MLRKVVIGVITLVLTISCNGCKKLKQDTDADVERIAANARLINGDESTEDNVGEVKLKPMSKLLRGIPIIDIESCNVAAYAWEIDYSIQKTNDNIFLAKLNEDTLSKRDADSTVYRVGISNKDEVKQEGDLYVKYTNCGKKSIPVVIGLAGMDNLKELQVSKNNTYYVVKKNNKEDDKLYAIISGCDEEGYILNKNILHMIEYDTSGVTRLEQEINEDNMHIAKVNRGNISSAVTLKYKNMRERDIRMNLSVYVNKSKVTDVYVERANMHKDTDIGFNVNKSIKKGDIIRVRGTATGTVSGKKEDIIDYVLKVDNQIIKIKHK